MAYYGTQVDYDLAKLSNPNADVRLYTPGATLSAGDYYLGNASGVNLNGAQALTGADRNATNAMFNSSVSSSAEDDIQAKIEALKQAQIQSNIASLTSSRDASLSSLATEKATIEPTYQKQKIAADVTAKQTARSFEEYMAQRGGGAAKSGISGQGQLMNNVAYQGQKGTLDAAEASALTTNAQRVTDVNNAYASDVASAQASAEATALQNYITQMNSDREYELNKQSTEASVASTNANTEYQKLVNAGYTATQAAAMAQAQAELTGTNLANDYQKLVNAGYPAQQAAELAQTAASTASKTSSSSGSTSYTTQQKSESYAQAITGLESLANGSYNGTRFTKSQILNWIVNNASTLATNGVDVDKLYKYADSKYTWEG